MQQQVFGTASSRCAGLFWGICAGDRNGGPQRMALRILESFFFKGPADESSSNKNSSTLALEDIARRYLSWSDPKGKHLGPDAPDEPEQAYDTGAVFGTIFVRVKQRLQKSPGAADALLMEAVRAEAQWYYEQRQSAGVNPAHRNAVLAMIRNISMPEGGEQKEVKEKANPDVILANAARAETSLTHLHPEAKETAAATAVLCRALIEGQTLPQALQRALAAVEPNSTEEPMTKAVLQKYLTSDAALKAPTYVDGRSPLVLDAALYFVVTSQSFDEALTNSLRFAGPANFCPVLVGSIAGALFGSAVVTEREGEGAFAQLKEADDAEAKSRETIVGVRNEHLKHVHVLRPVGHIDRLHRIVQRTVIHWE